MDTHDLSEEAEHWYNYFRSLFPRVTVESIDKFRHEYRLSEEERRDVIECHGTFEGDFSAVMENVMLAEDEDVQRLVDILEAAIDSGEVVDYVDRFRSTSKAVLKRAQKELKKMAGKSTAQSREEEASRLRELHLMVQRNSRSRERALDGLLAKYGADAEAAGEKGGKKSRGTDQRAKKGRSLPPGDIPDEEFEAIQRKIMNKSATKKQKK
jgi:DnaJ family protein C protein 9